MTKLSENIRKSWLKETIKEIKNLINNQNFLIEDKKEGEPVTPCMDVYKSKIQSDESLDKLKLRIVVRGDLQNKEMVGDTWSPTIYLFCKSPLTTILNFNLSRLPSDWILGLYKSTHGVTGSPYF